MQGKVGFLFFLTAATKSGGSRRAQIFVRNGNVDDWFRLRCMDVLALSMLSLVSHN